MRLLTAVAVEQEFGWDSVTHLSCMHALQLTSKIILQSPAMADLGLIQSPFKTIENLATTLALSSLGAVEKLSLCEFLILVSQAISLEEHINQDLLDICLPLSCSDLMPPKAELSLTALGLGGTGREGESC